MPQILSILNSGAAGSVTLKQSIWLHVFASGIHHGVLIADENRNIIFINRQLCSMLHLQQQPETFFNRHLSEFLNAASFAFSNAGEVVAHINDQSDQKKDGSKQLINLTDGKCISGNYQPVFSGDNLTGHIWLFSDETENIRHNESIKQEKLFFENILNQIPVDVRVLSPFRHYQYINPQAEPDELLRKWIIGKTDEEYFLQTNKAGDLAEKRKYYFEKSIIEKKANEWEETLTNENGTTDTFIRKLSPVYDAAHNLQMMIGFGININARKKVEAQLRLSEKKFRDLFTYSKAIICTHDAQGVLLTANPALCEATGYTAEEIRGKNIKDFLPSDEQEHFDSQYIQEITANKKVQGLLKIMHRSGAVVYFLYHNYLAEEPGQEPYIVSFSQDITERIIADKKLKEAQRTTEELIRSKEQFLADMSHEIRTPMNGILGISSLLQKTLLTNDQKFYLNIIEESAKKLLGIINQIQDTTDVSDVVNSPNDTPAEKQESHSVPGSDNIISTQENITMIEQKEPVLRMNMPVKNELGKLKVLLAEDNDINQVLVKNILKHWGFESKAVASGDLVVALLEEEDFDVVLMDIQMPHKSGIEVTQEIRLLSNPVKRNIPVIALTAFTIKGDERKYRDAGMDAFLTKPFKENDLYEAISKVLKSKKTEPIAEPAITENGKHYISDPEITVYPSDEEDIIIPTDEKLYDLSYLRGIQGSSPDLVNKLVEIFIRTVPPSAKEMVYASKLKDWDTVSKLAHKIKSSINTMGIHSLKGDVKFVEEYSAQKDELNSVASKIRRIDSIVSIAAQQLQTELNSQFSISSN